MSGSGPSMVMCRRGLIILQDNRLCKSYFILPNVKNPRSQSAVDIGIIIPIVASLERFGNISHNCPLLANLHINSCVSKLLRFGVESTEDIKQLYSATVDSVCGL